MKKLTYLICVMILSATERVSWGAQFLLASGGEYNQLQMTNALGTGDAYYAGVGYIIGARLRLEIPLVIRGSRSTLDFWGSYQNYQTINTADTSEKNALTPISVGIQSRLKILPFNVAYFLMGFDYKMTNSVITSGLSTYSKIYGTLGLSLGLEIPFTPWLSLQTLGTQHMGLAPGTTNNSGSRGVSELTGTVLLQLRLLQIGYDH
ncbi:MAG: hypothetical protein ABIQ95_07860 [Bdellovibrionia bacterium]